MSVSGLPLLLASALLVIASGVGLLLTDPAQVEELVGALLLMGTGLVAFGAWLALEIIGWRQRTIEKEDTDG